MCRIIPWGGVGNYLNCLCGFAWSGGSITCRVKFACVVLPEAALEIAWTACVFFCLEWPQYFSCVVFLICLCGVACGGVGNCEIVCLCGFAWSGWSIFMCSLALPVWSRLCRRGNCFLNKQRLILSMIANIFACGFVVAARFFPRVKLTCDVYCCLARYWKKFKKIFIPFIENCSDKFLRRDSFFLVLYCDLPKRGVLDCFEFVCWNAESRERCLWICL